MSRASKTKCQYVKGQYQCPHQLYNTNVKIHMSISANVNINFSVNIIINIILWLLFWWLLCLIWLLIIIIDSDYNGGLRWCNQPICRTRYRWWFGTVHLWVCVLFCFFHLIENYGGFSLFCFFSEICQMYRRIYCWQSKGAVLYWVTFNCISINEVI